MNIPKYSKLFIQIVRETSVTRRFVWRFIMTHLLKRSGMARVEEVSHSVRVPPSSTLLNVNTVAYVNVSLSITLWSGLCSRFAVCVSVSVCISLCVYDNFRAKLRLIWTFDIMVQLDHIYVHFVGQEFRVMGVKCLFFLGESEREKLTKPFPAARMKSQSFASRHSCLTSAKNQDHIYRQCRTHCRGYDQSADDICLAVTWWV